MAKAEKGNWDEDFKETGNGEPKEQGDKAKTLYMKMDQPGDYKIRLVGPHVKCRKHFKPYRAVVQDNEKDMDPAWKAGWFPQQRFAINVIDRADGKLKILEKGKTVFKHFANYKAVFGKDPAGKEGPDFMVKVTVPKGKDGKPNKLKTEYAVTHLKDAPFTAEEKAMIEAQKLWPLTDIYKSTPAEVMQKMWDELPADKKVAPKREFPKDGETPKSEPSDTDTESDTVEENMPEAPANTDDLFAGGTSKDGSSADMF